MSTTLSFGTWTSTTSGWLVSDIQRPGATMRMDEQTIPGRPGVAVLGGVPDAFEISCKLHLLSTSWDTQYAGVQEIAAVFADDTKRLLLFSDMDGIRYRAVPLSWQAVHMPDHVTVDVTWRVVDPIGYGTAATASLASGGSATVTIEGNWPAALRVTSSAAVRGASGVWGVTDESGNAMLVELPTASATAVYMDSDTRACTVAGSVTTMMLASDWLLLDPGEHTITMSAGTGAATLRWVPRWVR